MGRGGDIRPVAKAVRISFYVAAIVKPFGALFSFLVSPASLLVRIGLGCAHTGSVCE
jgi:hypothetical protein